MCRNRGLKFLGTHPHVKPPHHLYVYLLGSVGLSNNLALCDAPRTHPKDHVEYGRWKRECVERYPNEIDAYIEEKTLFILGILYAAFVRNNLKQTK